MIFHISIPTNDPENVAKVIAELWKGEAFPFFPHNNESWVAMAGDDRRSGIECYPQDVLITPSEQAQPDHFDIPRRDAWLMSGDRRLAVHAAIATPLSEDEVRAIGVREGWLARYAQRGVFGVVELWIENTILFEVLTPELQKQYVETQSLDGWHKAIAAHSGAPKNPSRPAGP